MPPSAGRKGRGSELPALWRTCPPPPRSLGPRAGGTGHRSELSPRQNRPSCPQPRCPRLPVTPGTDSLSLHTSGPSSRPGPGPALSARARLTCVSHRAPPLPRLCPPSRQRLLCSGTLTPTGPQRRLGACAHRPVGSPRCTLTLPPAPPLGTGSTRSAARSTPPAPQPARCAPCPSAHSLLPQGPLLSLGHPPAHTRAEGNPGSPRASHRPPRTSRRLGGAWHAAPGPSPHPPLSALLAGKGHHLSTDALLPAQEPARSPAHSLCIPVPGGGRRPAPEPAATALSDSLPPGPSPTTSQRLLLHSPSRHLDGSPSHGSSGPRLPGHARSGITQR